MRLLRMPRLIWTARSGGEEKMAKYENPRKNAEGYSDPTAYEALRNIESKEDERFHKLLYAIFDICDLAGFEIEGRIVLLDKKSGRVWR